MILNAYAVLSAFVVLLRATIGFLVIAVAWQLLHRWRGHSAPAERTELEDRSYLLTLLASWGLGLQLISWPLLYLLLQSYVPQWPGVMCIYGVTRIGSGSLGVSRFLPGLIATSQSLKGVVFFLSGAWLLLYRIHRGTQTGPLFKRVLLAQLMFGVFALADAVIDGAYLVIPKKEEFLFTGCCTAALSDPSRTSKAWISSLSDRLGAGWLSASFYSANLGLLTGLWVLRVCCHRRGTLSGIGLILPVSLLVIPVTAAYLIDVAAPAVLRLPYHHCLYDLIPRAPDMVVAIVLFVLGSCCAGWASVVHWLAGGPETRSFARSELDMLLAAAIYCNGGALLMTFLEVHLA